MTINPNIYPKPSKQILIEKLTHIAYQVTQQHATEPPFQNPYWNHFEKGIYVDVTTGEPLFSSVDKFESACGWPSFSKPIENDVVNFKTDNSFNMHRVEVLSRCGQAHLGHVFQDGPPQLGGQRYCINSAALKFIPLAKMEQAGYGNLIPYVEANYK